ncbi:histidine phosphatase family protein [Actinocrispum wychmicini]|uniref:Putative phosphoglycerate mutase n=1 Tax=Actinocrispum wychmicini TaxID=1213861 RepID=A0A4R2K3Z5_9PSEU|nr:histidine phosphatase family protein [Actinocrispum wychmicini]TCO64509.1 putative phosphoglycerate mutase [Actinocrispum wychmicini]
MSTLQLLLVRHGQTSANVIRALDSKPPGAPLTDEGHAQAAKVAARLSTSPVVAVYASTAIRAQETAAHIASPHDLEVQVMEGVQEVFVGDLEGRTGETALKAFVQVYDRWTANDLTARMPGGEDGHEIKARYMAAVDAIRAQHVDGLVVLVSHGGVIRLAAEWLADNVDGRIAITGILPNTGHVLLEADGDTWHCLEWTGLELMHG